MNGCLKAMNLGLYGLIFLIDCVQNFKNGGFSFFMKSAVKQLNKMRTATTSGFFFLF